MQVLRGVLKGVCEGQTKTCVVVDLLPYDGTLPLAVSRGVSDDDGDLPGISGGPGIPDGKRRKKEPFVKIDDMSCISILWAGTNKDEIDLRQQVRVFVRDRLTEDMKVGIRTGTSTLPDAAEVPHFRPLDSFIAITRAPTLDAARFEHTKPLADLTLPILQTVHDEFDGYFPDICREFTEIVAQHNVEFNPSGRAFNGMQGVTNDEDPKMSPADSVALVSGPNDPVTKEDVIAKFGLEHTVVLPGSSPDFEMIAVRDGLSDKIAPLLIVGSWGHVHKCTFCTLARRGVLHWAGGLRNLLRNPAHGHRSRRVQAQGSGRQG